jgi:hypothetical protein
MDFSCGFFSSPFFKVSFESDDLLPPVVVPIFFLRFRYYMLAFFFPCFESIITFNYYLDNQLKIFWYIGWRFRFLLVFDANELCALEH